jgi:hypothetical protein
MPSVSPAQLESFYRAATVALRVLDTREGRGRRFGDHADATWRAFRGPAGELGAADRLELLVREAAVLHRGAFSASLLFALPGLAADEPLGPEWPALPVALAETLVRSGSRPAPATELVATLREVAEAWGLPLAVTPALSALAARLGPASRAVVAGPSAIAAVAEQLAGRSDTDFADQLVLVSDHPGERQLFGVAALALGSRGTPRFLAPAAASAERGLAGALALVSDDAAPASRIAALSYTGAA